MKLRFVSIALVFVLVLSAGLYFLYPSFREKTISIQDLVPSQALVVLDIRAGKVLFDSTSQSAAQLSMRFFMHSTNQLKGLRDWSLAQGYVHWAKELNTLVGERFYVSAHSDPNQSIEEVYYLELLQQEQSALVNEWIKRVLEEKSFTVSKRRYQDVEIHELKKQNQKIFHFIFLKNWLIGSRNSFHLEDIIRSQKSSGLKKFPFGSYQEHNLNLSQELPVRMHVNLPALLSHLRKSAPSSPMSWFGLGQYAQPLVLDAQSYKNTAFWAGFTSSVGTHTLSKYLIANRPQEPQLWNYFPINCKQLQLWMFNSGEEFYQQLVAADSASVHPVRSKWNELTQTYRLSPGLFFECIKNEIAYLELKPVEENDPELAVLIKIKPEEMAGAMKKLEEYSPLSEGDSIHNELFKNETIHFLDINELPQKLFGLPITGFPVTYWCISEDVLLLANNSETIKALLECHDSELNWFRDTYYKNELIEHAGSLNYFSYFSASFLDDLFSQVSDSSLFGVIKQSVPVGFDVPYFFLAFSNETKEHQYLSLNIPFEKRSSVSTSEVDQGPLAVELSHPLIAGPFVFKMKNKATEVTMVQDSMQTFRMLDPAGKVVWEKTLSDPISLKPFLLPKKQQGAFMIQLGKGLQFLDWDGKALDSVIQFTTVLRKKPLELIDYDQSGNYRISASTESGELYLFDLNGQALEGWNPKKLEDKSVSPAKNIRVRGKDYLVCLGEKGHLYAFNRKGEPIKGFPVKLEGRFLQSPVLRAGSDEERSSINIISELGIFYRVSLKGQELLTKTLPRQDRDSRFIHLRNEQQSNWGFLQLSSKGLEWYDEKGNLLYAESLFITETNSIRFEKTDNVHILIISNTLTNETEVFVHSDKSKVTRKKVSGTHADMLIDHKSKNLLIKTRSNRQVLSNSLQLP